MNEGASPETNYHPSSAPTKGMGLFQTFYEEDDSSATTSSMSSGHQLLDETATKIKNAKYVFLTLREALLNSMVIIAVGCVGFWLIEGFSLVDSWYFTTVLLTTVGYGDIAPATNGGKLKTKMCAPGMTSQADLRSQICARTV